MEILTYHVFGAIIIASGIVMSQLFPLYSKNDSINNIDALEFQEEIVREDNDVILIDIRTPQEFYAGHIEGAKLINYYSPEFMSEMKKYDKNARIFIYCRSGNRSSSAAKQMAKEGFQNINNLKNGIISWVRQGYSIKK